MYWLGSSMPSFFNDSKSEVPPLEIVEYSQCNYILRILEFASISPSKAGSKGKIIMTLNF